MAACSSACEGVWIDEKHQVKESWWERVGQAGKHR